MYKIELTNRFKKGLNKLKKNGFDTNLLYNVITLLQNGKSLPEKYCNHPLKGKYKGYYDCHILPDLILIYKIEKEKLTLVLLDIGTHSNLF